MRLIQQKQRVESLALRADLNARRKSLLGQQLHEKASRYFGSMSSLVWTFGTGALWAATRGSSKRKKGAAATRKLLSLANLTWLARMLLSHKPAPLAKKAPAVTVAAPTLQ